MEIIEKQTIKEVPVDGNYGYGYLLSLKLLI